MAIADSRQIEQLRRERQDRRSTTSEAAPVEITIRTWVPEKYLLIDLETGDVWEYDQDGRPKRYGFPSRLRVGEVEVRE